MHHIWYILLPLLLLGVVLLLVFLVVVHLPFELIFVVAVVAVVAARSSLFWNVD